MLHLYMRYIDDIFLAPTGAQGAGILCVRLSVRPCVWDILQNKSENEFLKHSKESKGVLGQVSRQSSKQLCKQASKQAGRKAGR